MLDALPFGPFSTGLAFVLRLWVLVGGCGGCLLLLQLPSGSFSFCLQSLTLNTSFSFQIRDMSLRHTGRNASQEQQACPFYLSEDAVSVLLRYQTRSHVPRVGVLPFPLLLVLLLLLPLLTTLGGVSPLDPRQ